MSLISVSAELSILIFSETNNNNNKQTNKMVQEKSEHNFVLTSAYKICIIQYLLFLDMKVKWL